MNIKSEYRYLNIKSTIMILKVPFLSLVTTGAQALTFCFLCYLWPEHHIYQVWTWALLDYV